jgi:SAM-dependent methyltransferase
VLQILKFNWRMYLATAVGACAAWFIAPLLPAPLRAALLIGAAPAVFWMASSLLVSHYVYDRFPLYDLHWLQRSLAHVPRRWINIHAGWDETSALVAQIFPDGIGEAVDIYDPRVMTETSIRQARQANRSAIAATPALFDALPFEKASVDAAFAIFAAHELRRHDQRVKFFREVARILTSRGEFVLVEHARDWQNLLAFGPGFLHFFSRRAWHSAAADAGVAVRTEFKMTPFVRVYIMRRCL